MQDPFDKLIAEVKAANKKTVREKLDEAVATAASRPITQRPDALVLCTMHIVCENCGAAHDSPGHYLLLRTGRNYVHLTKSAILFADLPREHIVKDDTAPSCSKCFGAEPTIHFQ